MDEALDTLEREMEQLRRAARTALAERSERDIQDACDQLRLAESAWYARIGQPAPATPALPPRGGKEEMRQTLRLIGAPAAPKVIRAVSLAFTGNDLPWSRLASVRRDEERRHATNTESASYICPALGADTFTPLRGLYALSEWPLEQRLRTPLSARADFLTMIMRIAAHEQSATASVRALLQRLADEIPGTTANESASITADLMQTAETELRTIAPDDQARRTAAAQVARRELNPFQQIFGAPRD
ncbi:hypothetical protein [Streptomyces yaizuensis]|uniref:SNF7 family protein n=1 Tax=Streptomyces yaizuensis TaxID=2989713 RepID=A0ABQ5P655_9ACTN|nr:hypothetical protein [Streptomyces sp. YSPA8]GLF98050.1 SNF7 family protein [Streptomyces sp. YSPA8]